MKHNKNPIVLIALNAKYPHTNPAVRSIAAYARNVGAGALPYVEYTVNQRPELLLSRLYNLACDVYLFSCYIWNIELVRALAVDLRKLRPDAKIWAGGPEVGHDSVRFLVANLAFDLVVRGEGEETVSRLLCCLNEGRDYGGVPGITRRQGDHLVQTADAAPMSMDALPFPYGDLAALGGRVLYYESMRGCPYRCSYCVSSIEEGVRFRSLELVLRDLRRFLDARVPRVKFVDRTFNCDRSRAREVWRFLQQQDNGVTNFHFELAGELLDEESIALLSDARPGLFQFEIGVQSANRETLRAICRPSEPDRLFALVERLRHPGNIHLHLDLIAGLPEEDLQSFTRSFDRVYRLHPHQLQLGFLKVLPGSAIRRDSARHGLVYRERAPYEVLSTRWMDFGELHHLKGVARMLELYYNSGRFHHLIRRIAGRFDSPFDCYQALWDHWLWSGYEDAPPDRTGHYAFLGDFLRHYRLPCGEEEQWLCRLDLLLHDRPRKMPAWVTVEGISAYKKELTGFYKNSAARTRYFGPDDTSAEAARRSHLERFPFNPLTGNDGPVFLLFQYGHRDLLGRARVSVISPEQLAGGGQA